MILYVQHLLQFITIIEKYCEYYNSIIQALLIIFL